MFSQCNTEVVPAFPCALASCCCPSCRVGEVSGAEDGDQEDLLSGGVVVDVMLGLLLSFQTFTVNRHHAGREVTEALHESKLNRP